MSTYIIIQFSESCESHQIFYLFFARFSSHKAPRIFMIEVW
jgi:hypothetical protein